MLDAGVLPPESERRPTDSGDGQQQGLLHGHLEPDESTFSTHHLEWNGRYKELIRVALLDKYPTRACQMVNVPSFRPEYAVFVVCVKGNFRVIARSAPVSIWDVHMHRPDKQGVQQVTVPDVDALRPGLQRGTVEYSAPLPAETFELLDRLWSTMLLLSRPSPSSGGVDGETYYFANRSMTAMKHSPYEETPAGQLAQTGERMIEFARIERSKHAGNDLEAVARKRLRSLLRIPGDWATVALF